MDESCQSSVLNAGPMNHVPLSTLQSDVQRKNLAKKLYSELKIILLGGESPESRENLIASIGTESVHSFVIEKVNRKISEQSLSNTMHPSSAYLANDVQENFIKKEIKKVIRRIFRSDLSHKS